MTDQKKQPPTPEQIESDRLASAFAGMGSQAAKATERAREQRAIHAKERAASAPRTGAELAEQERALILAHTEVSGHVAEYRRKLQGGQRDHLRDMVLRGYAAASSANTIGEFDPTPYEDPDDREHEDRLHGTSTQVVAKAAPGRRGPTIFRT